jgi:hypothetical protein
VGGLCSGPIDATLLEGETQGDGMDLFGSAALIAASLATAAPSQGAEGAPGAPAAWRMSPAGGCEAVLGDSDPERRGLVAFIETELRDAPYYILITHNLAWQLPRPGEGAFLIGLDDGAPQPPSANVWLEERVIFYIELDAPLRTAAAGARVMHLYSGARRIGSIPLDNLGPSLATLETCLAELARATRPMQVIDAPPEGNPSQSAENPQAPRR